MTPEYIHLSPNVSPPALLARPYRAVLIAEMAVEQDWRNEVASWLIRSGCLYFVSWGIDCENWHDTMDWTLIEEFDLKPIPDDRFIMTTWLDKEPLSGALWFAGNCTEHPDVDFEGTVIVHVAGEERRAAMLELYDTSQTLGDD